ncbi:MAG: hypothetical protein M3Y07_07580 [Acidobacteriota bacterium]|nr:hypothetical protein [Acidobacteriota bacterium]
MLQHDADQRIGRTVRQTDGEHLGAKLRIHGFAPGQAHGAAEKIRERVEPIPPELFLPGAFPNRVHGFGERKFAGDPARRFDETFGRPCRGRPAQSGGERFSSIAAKRMQHDLVESGRAYLGDAAIEQRTRESAARRGERNRAAVR